MLAIKQTLGEIPTPNLNAVIDTHNETMKGWWKLPEYIRERKAFVIRYPVCIRCGRPAVTPGHSHEDYRDFQTYLNAVKTDKCDPLCSSCNKAERAGKRPCPECVKAHKGNPETKIHYITQEQDRCRYCEPGYDPEKIKENRQKRYALKKTADRQRYNAAHPMVKRVVDGKWVKVRR